MESDQAHRARQPNSFKLYLINSHHDARLKSLLDLGIDVTDVGSQELEMGIEVVHVDGGIMKQTLHHLQEAVRARDTSKHVPDLCQKFRGKNLDTEGKKAKGGKKGEEKPKGEGRKSVYLVNRSRVSRTRATTAALLLRHHRPTLFLHHVSLSATLHPLLGLWQGMAASQFLGGTCCTLVFSEEFLRPVENFPPCIPRRSVDVGFSDDFRARKIFHVFQGFPTQSRTSVYRVENFPPSIPRRSVDVGFSDDFRARKIFHVFLGLPTQSWRACWVDNKSTCGHPSTRLVGGGTGALTCRMCFYILN
jgi:hypothetical protein